MRAMQLSRALTIWTWRGKMAARNTRKQAKLLWSYSEDVDRCSSFVSHAWKGRFAQLVRAVKQHLRNAPDHTRVWIDCFAVNQHQDTMPDANKADVASFEATIKQCHGGTIVVVDMKLCNPASRGWCLYEWNHTVMHHSIKALQFVGYVGERSAEDHR